MQIVYAGLERDLTQWKANYGPDINPASPVSFTPYQLPDGRLKVTNVGAVKFAGGLVSRKLMPLVPPSISGFTLSYAKLSTKILIPFTCLYNVARLETDLMYVVNPAPTSTTVIPNRFNGSTQLNFDTGHFMIDASSGSAAWSDIGGGPGKDIAPDVAHLLEIRYQFDYANLKTSTLSISWDGIAYPVPTNLQGVGCQSSNWTAVASIQKQTEMYNPGSVDVVYDATTLIFSDQPL